MMKKITTVLLYSLMLFTMVGFAAERSSNNDSLTNFNVITATEFAARIRVGWNLGNTLDAGGDSQGFSWLGGGVYANTTVTEMETAWVDYAVTREMINAVSDAGFNTIRIPVTWFKAADDDYNIREDWMARVKEIVDYAVDNDMYIILNSHHDDDLFRLHDRYMDESKAAFARIWEQVAYAFRDYNEKLAFQGLNEPRTRGSAAEWSGGTPEERANVNVLNQLFVDTIRQSGGNNAERVLMIPTYAASSSDVAQRALIMPIDSVEDRIIVTIHSYAPWEFALRTGPTGTRNTWSRNNTQDTGPIISQIDMAYRTFVRNGIPVVITEMGALNRNNTRARAEWAEFFIAHARSRGIPCVWWDNSDHGVTVANASGGEAETFGLFDRRTHRLVHPDIVDALMRATE